jgi:hypothetical protein
MSKECHLFVRTGWDSNTRPAALKQAGGVQISPLPRVLLDWLLRCHSLQVLLVPQLPLTMALFAHVSVVGIQAVRGKSPGVICAPNQCT